MSLDIVWLRFVYTEAAGKDGIKGTHKGQRAGLRAVAEASAQAERHRIFAAIDADYGAFLRDQGFQEWRAKKQQEATN